MIESFTNIGEERILNFANRIDGNYVGNYDKDLSFVILDDRQTLIGFVLLRNESIPNTYTIDGDVAARNNGVEILQIYFRDQQDEAYLLRVLINRVTIWSYNGAAAFNYIWSITHDVATHFNADALNGDIYTALISVYTIRDLLYVRIRRDEE